MVQGNELPVNCLLVWSDAHTGGGLRHATTNHRQIETICGIYIRRLFYQGPYGCRPEATITCLRCTL